MVTQCSSQALALHVETKFSIQTARVKCVDLHPDQPWVLATLHTGEAHIYDYVTQVENASTLP